MLQVRREAERKDHFHGDLSADELENRRALRNREQEDVSFLIG